MIKIPEDEIRKRMQKLWNYEKVLHPRLKERSNKLRTENKVLKNRVKELEERNKQIEKLQLQLEELRILQFGKKRLKTNLKAKSLPENETDNAKGGGKSKQRPPETYRRTEPIPEQITDHLYLELTDCPECGGELKEKKEHTHYREDLYEVENLIKSAQKIVKTVIESGKCPTCKTRQYAMEIPKQKVIIGENIRSMVVYLTVVQGQSYSEVQGSLKHQYGVNLSSGEIANILEGESRLLTPYYNNLVEELEEESKTFGAHYDETGWKTESRGEEMSEGNYCWVKIGVESNRQLIWLGRSRGKGVAEKLRGVKEGSIGITDDYGAYRNTFDHHGLCWAHPNRKLRDLAQSTGLSGRTRQVCQKAYKDFAKAYKKAEKARKKLKAKAWTDDVKANEREKLEKFFNILFVSTPHDPEKLKAIRKSLKERKQRYFTFFDFPHLPLDNNKAERALRKVVLKRKKSFGSRSPKGANILSILYSVIFSVLESSPDENFFKVYREAAMFEGVSE